MRYLLECPERRELLGVADVYDRTAAHDAAENGHVECLQLLVEAGVSLYLPDQVRHCLPVTIYTVYPSLSTRPGRSLSTRHYLPDQVGHYLPDQVGHLSLIHI